MYLNISPNPGISFSINSFTASGVESLPVNPVPPVNMTTLVKSLFSENFNSLVINFLSRLNNIIF